MYYRLHGSPRMYDSAYPAEDLDAPASRLAEAATSAPTWCIFDNTALWAATADAFAVLGHLGSGLSPDLGSGHESLETKPFP